MSHDGNHLHDSLHVAIIMDGNGRWAARRGLPRTAGHRAGADAVRRVVEAAPTLGITTLTMFAFSSDNWRRPRDEVAALMSLLRRYLQARDGSRGFARGRSRIENWRYCAGFLTSRGGWEDVFAG